MSRLTKTILVLVGVVVCVTLAWAATRSVDDLVQLKQIGFTDEQIKQEVIRSGGKLKLTPSDVAKLKAAGIGDPLIAFLQSQASPAPGRLTVAKVIAMAEAGRTAEQILKAIAGSGQRFQVTAAESLQLAKKKVPLAVILAMKGSPVTKAGLLLLGPTGLSETGFSLLSRIVGLKKEAISPAEALALAHAGVPTGIVRQLREGAPPTPPKPDPKPAPKPRPIPPIPTDWTGTAEYRHLGKHYVLRFPKGWRVVRSIDEGELATAVTPLTGYRKAEDLPVCVRISLLPIGEASSVAKMDAVTVLTHFLPTIRYEEPDLIPAGDVKAVKLSELDAASVTFHGKLEDKPGRFTIRFILGLEGKLIHAVMMVAPEDRYAKLQPLFERILAESRFGRTPPPKPTATLKANAFVRKYKTSVVAIGNAVGTGTGFIISKDGYVLTNYHVVWDSRKGAPIQEHWIEWDESLGRSRVKAELIGFEGRLSRQVMLGGVDVALLKIPAGDYEPIPLTPMSQIELGDRVITMGFPQRGRLRGLSLTITEGVVTRFNRNLQGGVDSIFTNAKIAKGNSGGPCISLETGGAIGLNTWTVPIRGDQMYNAVNEVVGYYALCTADTARLVFPLVCDLGLGHRPSVDCLSAYDLARLYLRRGGLRAGRLLASHAVGLDPSSADTHCLLGEAQEATAAAIEDPQRARQRAGDAIQCFQKALSCDPNHLASLTQLGTLYRLLGQADKAIEAADRAIQAHPKSWSARHLRARLAADAKDYALALSHLDEVKKVIGTVLAEPYIMAGEVLYAMGRIDDGQKQYAEGVRVHPTNLEAQLGVAQADELRKDFKAAAAAYQKVLGRFPDHPIALDRLGMAQIHAGKVIDGLNNMNHARKMFANRGLVPPERFYFDFVEAFLKKVKTADLPIEYMTEFLEHYGQTPSAVRGHFKLADVFQKIDGGKGVAFGHLSRIKALTKDPQIDRLIAGLGVQAMSLDDIKMMLKLKYPARIAADVVAFTPLASYPKSKAEVRALIREHKLPGMVVFAIGESGKRFANRKRPQPPHGKLAGTWLNTALKTEDGDPVQLVLLLTETGRFTLATIVDGGDRTEVSGAYTADGGTITAREDDGAVTKYGYQLRGDELVLDMPQIGGKVVLRRGGSAPPPPAPLIGTWAGQLQAPDGRVLRMLIAFQAGNRFSAQNFINGALASQVQGDYRSDGRTITVRNQQGQITQYPYRLQGNQLLLTMPGIQNEVAFSRQ